MLSKLLKYEFKSTCRTFLIVYVVMAALSVLTGALDRANAVFEAILPIWVILTFLTTLFFFAAVIITTVLNINRFYRGLFKDEGYLIHTLPVRSWQIIAAKLIPAVIWTIATVAVMMVSMALMLLTSTALTGTDWGEVFSGLLYVLSHLDFVDISGVLQILLMLLILLVSTILQVYASLSIGQLFPRHRVAWSVAAWFVLGSIQSISMNLLSWLETTFVLKDASILELTFSGNFDLGFAIAMIYYLLWCAVFWAISQLVLSRGLNLE
ncbi:MAG: hypothetical protein ACI3VN_08610 [Candidatus Onthomonas sp.]